MPKEEQEEIKDWTLEELQKHIRSNFEEGYNAMVVISALYKVAFNEFPKIGLSGYQAGAANFLVGQIENLKENS